MNEPPGGLQAQRNVVISHLEEIRAKIAARDYQEETLETLKTREKFNLEYLAELDATIARVTDI